MLTIWEELKKKVIHQLTTNKALQDALRTSFVSWHVPVVGISDILLENPPIKFVRTVTGVRELTNEEYAPIMKNWRDNLIGGSSKFTNDYDCKNWDPPTNAELFLLQRIEHEWGHRDVFEYLLLMHEGKKYFLVKKSGRDNNLRVLADDEDDLYFGNALRNVLMWKSKD